MSDRGRALLFIGLELEPARTRERDEERRRALARPDAPPLAEGPPDAGTWALVLAQARSFARSFAPGRSEPRSEPPNEPDGAGARPGAAGA